MTKIVNNDEKLEIEFLDIKNLIPREKDFRETGGAIYLILGATGSGKTKIIKSLLLATSYFIPIVIAVSPSEEVNNNYSKIIPNLFIYNEYSKDIWEKIKARQIIAESELENPLLTVIYDDCMIQKNNFGDQIEFFKNSRQYFVNSYIASQAVFDLKPELRDNLSGIFILKSSNETQRGKIYKNYASMIPNEKLFNDIMDIVTADYGALYIDYRNTSQNWIDKIKWFKSFDEEILNQNTSVVSKDVVAFNKDRENKNYNSKEILLKNYFSKNI